MKGMRKAQARKALVYSDVNGVEKPAGPYMIVIRGKPFKTWKGDQRNPRGKGASYQKKFSSWENVL